MKCNIFISKLYLNFAGPEIILSLTPSKFSTTGFSHPWLVLSDLHMCSKHANALWVRGVHSKYYWQGKLNMWVAQSSCLSEF